MIGIPESQGELIALAVLILLRGVTSVYFKEYMMCRITYGYDGPKRNNRKTVKTLTGSPALIHKIYLYYLQLQQLLLRGRWLSGFMLAQMLLTFIFHHYMIRHEKDS